MGTPRLEGSLWNSGQDLLWAITFLSLGERSGWTAGEGTGDRLSAP